MNEPLSNETHYNEHGAEITGLRIFRWDELDTTRWDADQVAAQIVTGEHMHLIRAVYEPGATYEMHSHPYDQFRAVLSDRLLLSGRLLLTVGDETREIGPGDGWYAPTDVPHGGRVLGDEQAVFIDVYSPATTWILNVFAEGRRVERASE
ncbi:cupin domain-containing protein [Candidatus Poriferisodalis sp.]|uniref:cupin domain-containing protein n=1 Tax=Candidatus Poriferisodalis sp. TaxID=3101277 RepID=UPI003B517F60